MLVQPFGKNLGKIYGTINMFILINPILQFLGDDFKKVVRNMGEKALCQYGFMVVLIIIGNELKGQLENCKISDTESTRCSLQLLK